MSKNPNISVTDAISLLEVVAARIEALLSIGDRLNAIVKPEHFSTVAVETLMNTKSLVETIQGYLVEAQQEMK
ncbi:MAG: hypothetical protein EB060_04590 [Proteobacteria bacterium]|nr:hypothetical protein [Pseudomonadota bacterium]